MAYPVRFDNGAPGIGIARPFATGAGVVLAALCYTALLLVVNAHPVVLALAMAPFAALFLFARPIYTLYLSVGAALLVDEKLTPSLQIHRGLSELSNDALSWLILSPLELLLLAALIGCLFKSARHGEASFKFGSFWRPMALFMVFVVIGLMAGLLRGGDARIALWELRAIFYMPAVYLAFGNIIKTRAQLHTVMWIVLLAIAVDAFLASWTYFVVLGRNLGNLRAITDHQQAIFFAALVLFSFAHALYRSPKAQGLTAVALLPLVLAAFIAANRRAGYVALVIGLLVVLALAYRDNRRTVLKITAVLGLLALVYVGAFWNSSSFLAKPLQGIKSVDARPGTDDYLSNLYRVQEKWNIVITMHNNPLAGVGFGRKFEMPIQMAYFSSPLRDYVTHNSIMWVWMKAGAGGFIAFLLFLAVAIARAARIYRSVEDRQLKPALATGLAFIMMYSVCSYVDQGWDYKGMVFIGVILGSYAFVEGLRMGRATDGTSIGIAKSEGGSA